MKILEITDCRNCPHFKAVADNRSEETDSYYAHCNNPDMQNSENRVWYQRIRNIPVPEDHCCPLPDKQDYVYDNYIE